VSSGIFFDYFVTYSLFLIPHFLRLPCAPVVGLEKQGKKDFYLGIRIVVHQINN